MTIEELATKHAYDIPNAKLVKYYEAAIPQYHVDVVFTILKDKCISVLQEYILKFVEAGINNIAEISKFLGINIVTVNKAIACMYSESMLSVDIHNANVKLTDKGVEILRTSSLVVPESVPYTLYVDGLIGNIYFDTRKFYNRKKVNDFNLTAIVPVVDRPTIDTLSFDEIKRSMSSFKKTHEFEKETLEGTLQEVSQIIKTYVEYKKVSVLVYCLNYVKENVENIEMEDIELYVYEGTTQNEKYRIALQRLYNTNTKVIDFDEKNLIEYDEHPLYDSIPQEIIANAKVNSRNEALYEREISTLTTQLTELQNNQSVGDQESFAKEETLLKKKIEEKKKEHQSANRMIFTYEHRPLLISALEHAKDMIVIISPWIKSSGLDSEILNLIDKAAARGAKVIIGYGISKERGNNDAWVLDNLKKIRQKKYGKNLQLFELNNTHEKVLIKDNEFMVITSFNWLSFKGDANRGFRGESGIYTEETALIESMKQNLSGQDRLGINLI